jgi:HSP20 family molecular chaperone IbpA
MTFDYWNRQIEIWMDIFSDDEPDLIGLNLVREFNQLFKKFYTVFDNDLNEIESKSHLGFRSETFREEANIVTVDSYSGPRPTREPISKKITKKAESVPVFAKDLDLKNGIEKVGNDTAEDVIVTDKNVKLVSQLPINNKKENIKVVLHDDNSIKISYLNYEGKLCTHSSIIPYGIDFETVRSTYKNGILEIIFDRK